MGRMIRQSAALAVRDDRVCMVSSRNGRRWVVPKGQVEKGQTPAEAALAEAWEEAGLLGRIDGEPLGTYTYYKNDCEHVVTLFPMTVTVERDEWPECQQRRREWVEVEEALARIDEPDLRQLVQLRFGLAEAATA